MSLNGLITDQDYKSCKRKLCNKTIDSAYPYSKNISFMVQSYALYVLSKKNIYMKDAANNLYEVRDRIPIEGISYLIKGLERMNDLPEYMQANPLRSES